MEHDNGSTTLSEETKQMLDSMPGGVFVFRITSDGSSETVYINSAMLDYFETRTPEEFAAFSKNNIMDLVIREDSP
ncbi:MAG: hypothetical protein ACI4LM_02550, partial [Anaerovoracaceae bacterium]